MTTTPNARFAAWLKETRTGAGLSQQRVADALKAQGYATFQQTTIAKIERGARPVRLDEAVAMTALFGTTIDVALGLKPGAPESFAAQALARRTSVLQRVQALVNAELGGSE
ncbi:helix-turn-helix transcriptional regulator [Streptomyces sp. NPDC004008]